MSFRTVLNYALGGGFSMLLLTGSWLVQAQSDTMHWGEIPDEHAEMTAYAADTTAGAVILGNFAEITIEDDQSMIYDVHRRIKLFDESAFDMATVEFRYIDRQRFQRVQRLDAQTFVRDADGELQAVPLHSSDVFEEEDGNFTRVRFTLPALEPGAIIEYRYRIRSEYAQMIPNFLFQHEQPTLWSEFRVRYPAFLTISRHPIGSPTFYVEEIDEPAFRADQVRWVAGHGRRRGPRLGEVCIQVDRVYRPVNVPTTTLRWVMTDVQAIREESHVASIWNHAYGMQFHLAGYTGADGIFRPIAQSWQEIADNLRDHDNFGQRLRAPRAVRNKVADLIDGTDSDAEKLRQIYNFIRTSITWDETYRVYVRQGLDRVLEARRGTSAEINLLLIAMLREAGVEASPVLISTRRAGRALGWFASTGQFNNVIAMAEAEGQEYFLDATDPHRPVGMLPVQALNVEGWRLTDDNFGWIPIQPGPSSMTVEVDGMLSSDGGLTGTIRAHHEGYTSLKLQHRLGEATDDEERARAVVRDRSMSYTDVVVAEPTEDGQIQAELTFEWEEYGKKLAHLLTLEPILVCDIEQNPFAAPERSYPVDFAYPTMHSYSATIQIPPEFVVDELPQHVRLATPGNGIRYARVVTFVGGKLHVQRRLDISQTYFEPSEYSALRELYDEITAADAAVVVLVRTSDSHLDSQD